MLHTTAMISHTCVFILDSLGYELLSAPGFCFSSFLH